MKIDKNVSKENYEEAIAILNKLRVGKRVFGNPAEGLNKTLKELDAKVKNKKYSPTEFKIQDKESLVEIKKLKAGINGEKKLAEYLETIIKYEPKLDGLIVFASLSYEQDDNNKDYIPDTDFLAIYGNNIMILDAKNIITSPDIPIFLDSDDAIKTPNKVLLEVHPSNYLWENIFKKNNIQYNKIDGCVVIINNNGATIFRNQNWYKSTCRPVFIGELKDFLIDWIEKNPDPVVSLNLLASISKTQIKKEKSNLDMTSAKRKFHL